MFDVDSLGSSLYEDISVSDYDEAKNNLYYVNLPRHEDKFKTVPSNYPIALKVLGKKNDNHLESKNLIKEYNDVFYQLDSEGIIERITINPPEVSLNNFYSDNQCKTSNSTEELISLYAYKNV